MEKEKIIEVSDTLHLSQVDISFLANLLNSWDLDKTPITYNDLHGLSRICDRIDANLKEVERQLKESLTNTKT